MQEQLTAAQAEVLELKLHRPVRALLDQVLIPPNTFSIKEAMDDYTFKLGDDGNIQMLDGDKAVDFTVEGVTDCLGSADKYAGVVRAMARNETVDAPPPLAHAKPKSHFGIR